MEDYTLAGYEPETGVPRGGCEMKGKADCCGLWRMFVRSEVK
ncbi:MAG: hypothetical protein JWQ10_242, partial [Herbaspirillum sp.]|nr:hypothetical protein [Herbaspirillum sp.]